MQRFAYAIIISVLVVFVACRKEFEGDRKQQLPPETFTLVDSIYRDSTNKLTTTVIANWWGQSQSGFIKGYEVSIDNQQTWEYRENQQGTFLLSLPFGQQSGDLPIYVRAIDNLGQKDPTPAVMVFPVKNSSPTIVFDYTTGRKTSTLPAFRYSWVASDIDGPSDIQNIEIVMNDTTNSLLILAGNVTAASFISTKLGSDFDSSFQVYTNTRTTPLPNERLRGIRFDQLNKIFIRSVDRVGAKSNWRVDSIFIRKPTSDFLMVNDYRAARSSVQTFYANQLNLLGAPYNQYDVVQDLPTEFPSDVFTTIKLLEFYQKMIWYSDDPNSTLGRAQLVTSNFFQQGGRMMMALEIPNDFPANAQEFSFTPVQQLIVPPSGTVLRMNIGETMQAYASAGSGWPVLKASSIISNARPFITFPTSSGAFTYDTLGSANLLAQNTNGTSPWTGVSNVMSKRIKISTGKPDMVFISLPLNRLNANNNMDSLFRKVLIGELQF